MHGLHGRGLWKGIVRHMEFFKKGIRYEVAKGDRIGFWEDKWCGGRPLKEEFLEVYSLAVNRMVAVADYAKLDFGGCYGSQSLAEQLLIGKTLQFVICSEG